MSIATEKVKLATERFLLVRINPARYVLPVSIGGGLYTITLPFIMNALQRNGATLTKDTSVPSVNDHWFQSESTGLLTVKLASAPTTDTNVLIAFHYMFFTATKYRSISQDPEDDATTIREWKPKLRNYPSVLQSFDNIFNGVFSINDTSIEIINEEREFQEFLTDDDTFYNKAVDIWLCITNETNIQKIFTGTIKNLFLSPNLITLNVVDSFNKLKAIASMGDSTDEIYYSENGFPNVDPKFASFAVPYIVGSVSRYETSVNANPVPGNPIAYQINLANEAVSSQIAAPGTSVNRLWSCCRQSGTVPTAAIGSTTRVFSAATGVFYVQFASMTNLHVGDTVKFNNGGGDLYARVGHIGSFTHLTLAYNTILIDPNNAFALSSLVTGLTSFAVVVYDATIAQYFYCVPGRDYSVSFATVTTGGNRYVQFTFVNNFEAAVGISGSLDPNKHKVFFRTTNSTVQTHADFIKAVLTLVGIPANTTSFTNMNSTLPVNARFQIPNFDEQDYDLYLKYVQDVLSSTLGYLRINAVFETEYNLIASPSSTDVRNSFLMLSDESGCDIEYQDIATKIIAFNPHNSSAYETSLTPSPSETRESKKARMLSGLENVDRFRHCLETITARIDQHIGLKSFRFAKYKFKTSTEDIDTELGDDLEMDNRIVVGASQIQDLKVITIEKSPKFVSIEASDFKGI